MFDNAFDFSPLSDLADWRVAVYLIVAAVILWLAKLVNQACAGYSLNDQLTKEDNKAVAVSFAGFLLSLCLVIHGILTAPASLKVLEADENAWLLDLGSTAVWSGIACILLLVSRVFNDKVLFPKFSNKKELVTDRNIGMGAAQAGSYIATALVIRAVLGDEESGTFVAELGAALVWFAITQALLFVFCFIYQKCTRFDLHAEIERDNAAAGVALGGSLVAFGLLLGFFVKSYDSLIALAIWGVVSAFLLIITRVVMDKLLLSGAHLDDEIHQDQNWGAALIEVSTAVGVSLLIQGAFF
ncbi:DUF350 domain-containing protein [Verrucomicrobiaceae bacterium 5K15]|uniref:DUF350 domain-containing protein n=1 Tax=Oceaniferula flava TaxID=2800421 RepID=A0AAE2SC74_9BACT|nr:DUF350 domain-containing protein [Oceaniferula flavus]MBK1855124.1 DUF350 domain-containing protein [Oceaniferula flavus]MBM1136430.1 DUF350 domain-containing protein [Oceaniferula flavus]